MWCVIRVCNQEIKKDGTPEGIARLENIEELLNGIKDFVEGQKNWLTLLEISPNSSKTWP